MKNYALLFSLLFTPLCSFAQFDVDIEKKLDNLEQKAVVAQDKLENKASEVNVQAQQQIKTVETKMKTDSVSSKANVNSSFKDKLGALSGQAETVTKKIKEKLNLNDEKEQKVQDINLAYLTSLDSLKAAVKNPAKLKPLIAKLDNAKLEKLKSVLSAKEFDMFKKDKSLQGKK